MRKLIKCEVLNSNPLLPFNYRHKISAMIYDNIRNDVNCKNIHDSKEISEFSFSNIKFEGKYNISSNGIIPSRYFYFYISSSNIDIINSLTDMLGEIKMFSNTFLFKIVSILPTDIDYNHYMFYSECLQTKKIVGVSGKETIISYNPNEIEFKLAIFNNLIKKYQKMTDDKTTKFNIQEMDIKYDFDDNNKKQSGLEKVKYGDYDYSLKYFKLKFELVCPDVLKRVAIVSGIGEKNNFGFGFIELI